MLLLITKNKIKIITLYVKYVTYICTLYTDNDIKFIHLKYIIYLNIIYYFYFQGILIYYASKKYL